MRIIGGEAKGRKLLAPPPGAPIRPALDRIRESVFSRVAADCEGKPVLDLFAGVGSFGLEAISRGARRALFVDSGRQALAVLRRNVVSLGFDSRCEVLAADAMREPAADREDGYALIFLDPPFKLFDFEADAERVVARLDELLAGKILEPGGSLVMRHPSRWRGELPGSSQAMKFGESTVHIFRR